MVKRTGIAILVAISVLAVALAISHCAPGTPDPPRAVTKGGHHARHTAADYQHIRFTQHRDFSARI